MTELIICSAAESEYTAALSWYAERSAEAANRFDTELDLALQAISLDPERFPKCNERHRFYLMRHFPYQVIYRQHEGHWVVIAIAHAARKPWYWSGR